MTTRHRVMREARSGAPWVLGGMLFFAAMSLIWWFLLGPGGTDSDAIDEIVIPEGTAARIAAGEPTFAIPNTITLASAGELRVTNHDTVTHTIAGQDIAPGETVDIVAEESEGEFVCTFHPGGALGFNVEGRGSLWLTVGVPTLILGLPTGLLLALAAGIAGRINLGDEQYA